jgi:hypothetical protein
VADPRALLDTYGNLYADEPATGFKRRAAPKAFVALRAVLDLHKPIEIEDHWHESALPVCEHSGDAWPCDTVKAITAALEEDHG